MLWKKGVFQGSWAPSAKNLVEHGHRELAKAAIYERFWLVEDHVQVRAGKEVTVKSTVPHNPHKKEYLCLFLQKNNFFLHIFFF